MAEIVGASPASLGPWAAYFLKFVAIAPGWFRVSAGLGVAEGQLFGLFGVHFI